MDKKTTFLIAAACIVGVGGFFTGTTYAKSQKNDFAVFTNTGSGQVRVGTGQMANAGGTAQFLNRQGGTAAGEIIAKDETSLTIKLPTGGSEIIFLSPSTSILKSVQGNRDDLSVGTN